MKDKRVEKIARKLDSAEKHSQSDNEIAIDLANSFDEDFREEILESFSETAGRYSDWGVSGNFVADGTEYNWIENEEEAERIAKEMVVNDLEDEPGIFTQSWLEDHIDDDRADEYFGDIIYDDGISYADEIVEEDSDYYINRLAEELVEMGIISEEDGKDYDINFMDYAQDFAEKYKKDRLAQSGDGYEWFKDLMGAEVAMKEVLDMGFIDIDEAADDAISVDGWAHFISHYDGGHEYTDGGVVYFRED